MRPPDRISLSIGAILLLSTTLSGAGGAEKPNMVFIMCDDLGWGDLGCYGQKTVKTPNIDRLAEEGLRLTDFYAGCTVCRPSRLVLWTGKHSGHTPINSNARYHFRPQDVTVAELVKRAGYATGGVGKWAMGGVGTTGHPNDNGFDFWFGYLDQSEAHNYYPLHLWRNREKVPLAGNELGDDPRGRGRVATRRVTYSHDVMTGEALEFIRRHGKQPFLLHIHWTIPHANNEGGRVTGDGMEVPDHGIYADRDDWPSPARGQAAMITRMDRDVGRVVGLLKELGIERRTLVFFTSDNGPHSEGGHRHETFDANGPLRGFKRDLYEGGIRVPGIAWWPGRIVPGKTTSRPAAFQDWLPTACEIAGVPAPADADGISFLPALLGRPQRHHEYLYWGYGQKAAVRKGNWKAVRTGKDRSVELYDLDADIGETRDVAATHPDTLAGLVELMKRATEPRSRTAVSIGACDWTIGKRADPASLKLARDLGLEGVQVDFGDPSAGDGALPLFRRELQQEFLAASREQGVRIASLAMGTLNRHALKSDPRTEEWVSRAIDVARAMKVPVILLAFFGQGDLRDDPTGVDRVVARLKRLAPRAERAGVVLGIESWLSAPAHLDLIRRVGSPAVKVYYDVGNSKKMGYDIYAEIRSLGRANICEFHAKDYEGTFGKGAIDFERVRQAMESIGYRGWMQIESVKLPLGRTETVRRDGQYLRSVFPPGEATAGS